jgi:hypothetical protein
MCQEIIQSLPTAYDNEIKFDCLTGLRPAEAVVSVQLINDKDSRYTTNLKVSLWSTSVPEIFFRQRTLYISFVDPEILELAKSCGHHFLQSFQAYRFEGFELVK